MDSFTRNAVIGCAIVCAIVTGSFYAGSALGHGDLAGTDAKVEAQAAQSGSKEPYATFFTLSQNEEYIGFTLAGMLGGFIVGYAWAMVFDEADSTRGKARG